MLDLGKDLLKDCKKPTINNNNNNNNNNNEKGI